MTQAEMKADTMMMMVETRTSPAVLFLGMYASVGFAVVIMVLAFGIITDFVVVG